MPRAADALLLGQTRLFVEHGESLTFRESAVSCVVDRTPKPTPDDEYGFGNATEDEGFIELKAATLAALDDPSAPKEGEKFTDSSGIEMRVIDARSKGSLGWKIRYTSRQ